MATVLGKEQETKGFYKLSWVQRIGFGAGDLAQNLIYQTICMYLLFFYTDVYVLGGDPTCMCWAVMPPNQLAWQERCSW